MNKHPTALKSFISEPITVHFKKAPAFSKTPSCPTSFVWRGKQFIISRCLSEWKDFSRRGRMAQNMQPQHAQAASKHGSWGVGKFFFDIQTKDGRCFRLYYDRDPKDAVDRTGIWMLLAELNLQKDEKKA